MAGVTAGKRPTTTELNKMNKDDLKTLINTIYSELDSKPQVSENITEQDFTAFTSKLDIVLKEVKASKDERLKYQREVDGLKLQMNALQTENCLLNKAVLQQQRFLESIDAEKRKGTVILTGLSEDDPLPSYTNEADMVVQVNTDEKKVERIFGKIGQSDIAISNVQRLGERKTEPGVGGRIPIRALKVTLAVPSKQKQLVESARKLKDMPDPFKKIFIKKDMHPGVRREFNRLRESEKAQRESPDNNGRTIVYDRESRTIAVDGVVVDRFRSSFFH